MRILLDTNIIIHREAHRVIREDIGHLFSVVGQTSTHQVHSPRYDRRIEQAYGCDDGKVNEHQSWQLSPIKNDSPVWRKND